MTYRLGPREERLFCKQQPLTPRELEVLVLWCDQRQLTTAEMAAELWLAPDTVKCHVRHIHIKLGVTSRRELIRTAMEKGLL